MTETERVSLLPASDGDQRDIHMDKVSPRFRVLKTSVTATSLSAAAQTIRGWVRERRRVYVAVANVHLVMEGYDSPEIQQALDGAAMVTPDGMPLVYLGKLNGQEISRVYGPDLLLKILETDPDRTLRHYFYGGSLAANACLVQKLSRDNPGLVVAGSRTPPFRLLTEAEVQAEVDVLNAAQADIVWVALGAPKQEAWMARMRPRLNAPVLIGVGAAFDFLSGGKPQAPALMQKLSLEWLFRLACEPRRLWRRYVYHNPRFVVLALMQRLGSAG